MHLMRRAGQFGCSFPVENSGVGYLTAIHMSLRWALLTYEAFPTRLTTLVQSDCQPLFSLPQQNGLSAVTGPNKVRGHSLRKLGFDLCGPAGGQ